MTACTTIIKDNNNYGRGENYESCFQTKEMRHKISIMIKDYCMIKPFLAKGGGKKTHIINAYTSTKPQRKTSYTAGASNVASLSL